MSIPFGTMTLEKGPAPMLGLIFKVDGAQSEIRGKWWFRDIATFRAFNDDLSARWNGRSYTVIPSGVPSCR